MIVHVVRSTRVRHTGDCPTFPRMLDDLERRRLISGELFESELDLYVVTFADDKRPDVAEWLAEFTTPCRVCWPGTRDAWKNRPPEWDAGRGSLRAA